MFPLSPALHILGAKHLQFMSLQEVFCEKVTHRSKTKVYAKKKISFCSCLLWLPKSWGTTLDQWMRSLSVQHKKRWTVVEQVLHFYLCNLTCQVYFIYYSSSLTQITSFTWCPKNDRFWSTNCNLLKKKKKLHLLVNLNLLILSVTTQNDGWKYWSSSVGM